MSKLPQQEEETTPPTYEAAGVKFFRLSDVPQPERAAFSEWLYGQTMPIIPGLNPEDAVYLEDWNRWRAGRIEQEGLMGAVDSREPFSGPKRERDAFGRGVIAKLEKQGLRLP
jgi:hypothetical protein